MIKKSVDTGPTLVHVRASSGECPVSPFSLQWYSVLRAGSATMLSQDFVLFQLLVHSDNWQLLSPVLMFVFVFFK